MQIFDNILFLFWNITEMLRILGIRMKSVTWSSSYLCSRQSAFSVRKSNNYVIHFCLNNKFDFWRLIKNFVQRKLWIIWKFKHEKIICEKMMGWWKWCVISCFCCFQCIFVCFNWVCNQDFRLILLLFWKFIAGMMW